LELGVGTGRLAVPLAEAGWAVRGVDSSAEMLTRLAANATAAGVRVDALLADAGEAAGTRPWPRADVVLGAYNFLFNLPSRAAQLNCLRRAAATGARTLVLELLVPDPHMAPGEVVSRGQSGVTIRTVADPATSSIAGVHRGADGVDRPWRICVASPAEVDRLAQQAGWKLTRRDADWSGGSFDADRHSTHVSWYEPEPNRPGSTEPLA